jgi:hypothetical protein
MQEKYLDILQEKVQCQNDVVTFLHNTADENTAKKILNEGFAFHSHLDYTTDIVSYKDPVTIKYFTITRSAYGNFTIIIQISRPIIEKYSALIEQVPHHFSEVLSVNLEEALNNEMNFLLAPHFVKGYINSKEASFFPNNDFDPFRSIDIFDKNLNLLTNL